MRHNPNKTQWHLIPFTSEDNTPKEIIVGKGYQLTHKNNTICIVISNHILLNGVKYCLVEYIENKKRVREHVYTRHIECAHWDKMRNRKKRIQDKYQIAKT